MTDSNNPILRFVDVFKELAEGRYEPEEWNVWWHNHRDEVLASCIPGWALRLRMSERCTSHIELISSCQSTAIYILEALKIPHEKSDRYRVVALALRQKKMEELQSRNKARKKMFGTRVKPLMVDFPKFARFLKRRDEEIDQFDDPATDEEILIAEQSLGIELPEKFKQFLHCTKSLSLRSGLSIGLSHIFLHPAMLEVEGVQTPSISIADYFLEADGDQVLMEATSSPIPDPSVYYYAHSEGINVARKLSSSFTEWIEGLPKSEMFKQ